MGNSSVQNRISKPDPAPHRADIHERPGTRIRAFLAHTRGLVGCSYESDEAYQYGRELIEILAYEYDIEDNTRWDAADCANVLHFLSNIQPTKGRCYCLDSDQFPVSITCGYHTVLDFAGDQMRRIAGEMHQLEVGNA